MSRRIVFPEELSQLLGLGFSRQQLDAVTAPLEPGVVIAGAGSGKTTVMAARVVWLVGTGQVRPEEVLGLTFTRKAAAELSARVRSALLRAGAIDAEGIDEAGEQLIMTYDAFAARLVNDHGLRLGVEPDARMITGAARFRLASRVVAAAPGPFAYLARLKPDSVSDQVLRLDGDLASHLASSEEVRAESQAFVAEARSAPTNNRRQMYASLRDAAARASERVELSGLVDAYQGLKRDLGTVEFADQMAVAARLAREVPEVAEALRAQFKVVLLDEYQDTSSAQAELLRALFSGADEGSGRGHPVTAVGDPCQAIYGWRGAAASNIITFAHSFPRADGSPARAFPLTVNRRSGQTILDAANALAAPLRADPDLRWEGVDADLVAPEGTPPGDIVAATFDTAEGEASWIADRIAAARASGLVRGWRDIAVLTRRNATIRPLYGALIGRGVPVEIVGLDGLLQVPEVADVVSVLRVLGDVTANPDLIRVLTGPRWALGPGDLGVLGRRAAELAGLARPDGSDFAEEVAAALAHGEAATVVSLAEALDDPGDGPYTDEGRRRVASCAAELRALRRHVGDPVTDLVRRVISTLGLEVELAVRAAAMGEADGGSRQLDAFVAAVSAYVDVDGDGSLPGLLAYLRAETEHGAGLEQAVVSDEDSVKLMTIHRAKGLEWELVFLPALADGIFPGGRLTDNWLRNAGVLPAALRGDAASVPQLDEVTDAATKSYEQALKDELRRGDDRLAYVAVTRARQHLVATTHTWGHGLQRPRPVSPYLVTLASFGELELCEQPSPENPLEGGSGAVAWPARPDAEARARRLEAATEVRRVAELHRESGEWPEDRVGTLDDAAVVAEWDAAAERLLAEARQRRDRGRPVLPPYLSATALMALDADADGYLADLVRPMPARPVRASRVGLEFHAWLERRFRAAPTLPADELLDAYAPASDARELKRLIERFLAGRFADRTPHAVEVPFALVLGGQVVRGRIDAVYGEPGASGPGWLLIDWKTGAGRRANPLQLAVYRLAWAELSGVSPGAIDAAFYDVATDELIRPASLPGRAELEPLVARLVGAR